MVETRVILELQILINKMKDEKELEFLSFKRKIRKVLEGESILYDKICPRCQSADLIFRWSWRDRKYVDQSARCSSPQCKYGN